MSQQVAYAEVPPADRFAAGGAEGLGSDWTVLRDCRLRPLVRGVSPSVLIHPARGVAVLDILPSETPGAAEAVRAKLASVRFPMIFAGHLPVIHLRLTTRQMSFLPMLLDDAFAAQPPLGLPGGDAWVGVAARALAAEQPVSSLEARRSRIGPGRRRRRPAAVLRTIGAVVVSLVALAGVLAAVLGQAPAPVPDPITAAAVAPVAEDEAFAWEIAFPTPAPAPTIEPALSAPTPGPTRSGPETLAPLPLEEPLLMPSPRAAETSPVPSQRSATPPRRSEAAAPPAAKAVSERATPRRRHEAQAVPPATAGVGGGPLPEAEPQRCNRITALVGAGAPLGEGDMRFFNEACIRW